MTTEYAKAYRDERMAHADMKRRQRKAVSAFRAAKIASGDHSIRAAIGKRLVTLGERLSGTSAPLPSEVSDSASF